MAIIIVVKVLVFCSSDNKVLVLRRVLDDPNRGGDWDLPGGGADDGEEPGAAVIREAKEEAGLDLEYADLVFADTEIAAEENKNVVRLCYISSTQKSEVVISNEHSEYRWVSLDDLIQLFQHPVYGVFMRLVRDQKLTPSKK